MGDPEQGSLVPGWGAQRDAERLSFVQVWCEDL